VLKPCWDAIVGGLQWVGEKFDQVTNWIGEIWARIRGFLAKPINFMINTVWNEGIVPAWNKVADLLPGVDPIGPLRPIPENAEGGPIGRHGGTKRAGGGMLRGPGTGTSDSILGIDARRKIPTSWVSNREFVVRESIAKRTAPFLQALNAGNGEALQAAGGLRRVAPKAFHGKSGFDRNIPRRAAGGPVEVRIDEAKRWLSGPARGAPYVYGGGTNPRAGMDCSSMVSAVTHILSGRPPDSGRIGTTASMPWGGFAPGLNSAWAVGNKPADHMAGTLAGQNVEQHGPNGTPFSFPSRWGADNGYFTQQWHLPVVGGQFVSGGNGSGGGLASFIRGIFEELTNPALDGLRAMLGEPPPLWRKVPVDMATMWRDKILDFLFSKDTSSGSGIDVSGISGPVVDQVRQVAAQFGWSEGAEWDAIVRLIQKESSWNPNAANPTSNARGLFQKMTSAHGPVEPTPAGQAAWGLDYIRGRYGTPTAALAFHNARNYYAGGGFVRPADPFDNGGVARGKGIMFKDVIRDERVLDPEQTGDYDTLSAYRKMIDDGRLVPTRNLDPRQVALMAGAGVPGGREVHLHVHGDVNDPMDVDSLYNQLDWRERSTTL
jgi:hypothetical protein